MRADEILRRCQDVAHTTRIPVEWVQLHVRQRAGNPCWMCQGSGDDGHCWECRGTGGPRGLDNDVMSALEWVTTHVDEVMAKGHKRAYNADLREYQEQASNLYDVEQWKRIYNHLIRFVEGMLDGEFKSRVMSFLDNDQIPPDSLVSTLQDIYDNECRKAVQAPAKGSDVDVEACLGKGTFHVERGRKVYRVPFNTSTWRGRIETVNDDIIAVCQAYVDAEVRLQGTVAWSKDNFAILRDPDISAIVFSWAEVFSA